MDGFNGVKDLLRYAGMLCGLHERRCLRCAEPCLKEKNSYYPGGYGLALCDDCRRLLPRLESHFCPRCFLPFSPAAAAARSATDPDAALSLSKVEPACPYCCSNPPPWRDIYCYGTYDGELRELLLKAKFSGSLGALRLAGLLLSEAVIRRYRDKFADEPTPWDVVTAVPLHPARLRGRGLNQALEIARVLAKSLSLPLRPLLLRRVSPTTPQAGLSQSERRLNLRGAIVCTGFHALKIRPKSMLMDACRDHGGPNPGRLSSPCGLAAQAGRVVQAEQGQIPGVGNPKGLTVLLVDDILTTGTTLSRCVETLLNAGARSVDVAVAARTPLVRTVTPQV